MDSVDVGPPTGTARVPRRAAVALLPTRARFHPEHGGEIPDQQGVFVVVFRRGFSTLSGSKLRLVRRVSANDRFSTIPTQMSVGFPEGRGERNQGLGRPRRATALADFLRTNDFPWE